MAAEQDQLIQLLNSKFEEIGNKFDEIGKQLVNNGNSLHEQNWKGDAW